MGREIEIEKLFDEEIPVGRDDKPLIRDLDGVHLQDRSQFEIFFQSSNDLDLLVSICIEIDSRAFESDSLPFLIDQGMGIMREVIVYMDLTRKR